jgi:2,4-dienoyl-CoA reductase-like NADH-dependent reductase (Old Yellow Enzyme family)
MDGSSLLWSPFQILDVELRNRFVMLPHFTSLEQWGGEPSEDHVAYYGARARGGVGLIITGSQAIHPTGQMSPRFGRAWDPTTIPAYSRIAEGVHRYGTKIFGQLTHGGHTTLFKHPMVLWAPSQMPEPYSRYNTLEMGPAEIEAVIEGFAISARNLRDAGFDGIEIKVAHDGLLRSFVSPFFNRRTDDYGGSFENRMRLPLEVLAAMRREVGADVPLGVRMCLHEYTPFGYGLDYGLQAAQALANGGNVDYFDCDAGSFSSFWMEIPPAAVPQLAFNDLNTALKQVVSQPVIAFGRIKDPVAAEQILRDGQADLIGMARQLITDPETPNKVREGRLDDIRHCIACNDACVYQVMQENPIRCVHNPSAGREREVGPLVATETPLRVVVAGGGPAGLTAAETLARRGHAVTLYERQSELGGLINLAARQPLHAEIADATSYLITQVRKLGVDLHLGVEATPEDIALLQPDAVVVATGSRPYLPARSTPDGVNEPIATEGLPASMGGLVPGLDQQNVISVDDVLGGQTDIGHRVLVLDRNGHWESCGTAEYLLERGHRVDFITPLPFAGVDLEPSNAALFSQRVRARGMQITPNTDIKAISARHVTLVDVHSGDEQIIDDVDTVVLVIGRRSNDRLFWALEGRLPVYRIGDCAAPRFLQHATVDGDTIGRQIEHHLSITTPIRVSP